VAVCGSFQQVDPIAAVFDGGVDMLLELEFGVEYDTKDTRFGYVGDVLGEEAQLDGGSEIVVGVGSGEDGEQAFGRGE
jgi:hypothetical protein